MEFSYNEYTVRIVLNPSDSIIRFEHDTDYRIYERTFTDRDFPSFTVLGGITSIGKMLAGALDESMSDVEVEGFAASGKELSFSSFEAIYDLRGSVLDRRVFLIWYLKKLNPMYTGTRL